MANNADDLINSVRSLLSPANPQPALAMGVMDDAGDARYLSKIFDDLTETRALKNSGSGVKISKTANLPGEAAELVDEVAGLTDEVAGLADEAAGLADEMADAAGAAGKAEKGTILEGGSGANLLEDTGKFADDVLENNYQKYVERNKKSRKTCT